MFKVNTMFPTKQELFRIMLYFIFNNCKRLQSKISFHNMVYLLYSFYYKDSNKLCLNNFNFIY